MVNYLGELVAFSKWLENNSLSSIAQLFWYKLLWEFNSLGWPKQTSLDNKKFMRILEVDSEEDFYRLRNELVDNGLVKCEEPLLEDFSVYRLNLLYEQIYGKYRSKGEDKKKEMESKVKS